MWLAQLVVVIIAAVDGEGNLRRAVSERPRAAGYATNVRSPIAAFGSIGVSQGQVGTGAEFNPALLGGTRGFPGIKIRLNQRAFQYASTLVGRLLDSEIKRAHIPPIRQCLSQVNGCIIIYNLYVSRYRCPQRVVVYPAPPNRVVIGVQNLDIGVSGNLAGQITVLLPLGLSGIVHMNTHQVSIIVQLVVEHSAASAPLVRVIGCSATIGYVDVYIENGGFIGEMVNTQFRNKVSEQVRAMIPGKLCEMLPQIINEKVNPRLAMIPQSVPLTQLASLVNKVVTASSNVPAYCFTPACLNGGANTSQPPSAKAPKSTAENSAPNSSADASVYAPSVVSAEFMKRSRAHSAPQHRQRMSAVERRFIRSKRMMPYVHTLSGLTRHEGSALAVRQAVRQSVGTQLARGASSVIAERNHSCKGCPSEDIKKEPFSAVQDLLKVLDLSKLSNVYVTIQALRTHATSSDYTLDMNGEFSAGGQGGTPFGAFPMFFPQPVGTRMAEVLISDYTINSLFFIMHRQGFITFRIGPETPKIGDLLKTTCSDDEDDDDFDDTAVEVDEEEEVTTAATGTTAVLKHSRRKRQDDAEGEEEGGLADLGICFGDIVPAIREKYPNKKLYIIISTSRAPSIILSEKNAGMVTIDLMADAEIHIEETGEKVGAISIVAIVDITVHSLGTHLTGTADLKSLKLKDKYKTLGLPQDALDNLANLGKEMLTKVANDALAKGITLKMPTAGLPISLASPQFKIVDHAIHIEFDFTVSPSLFGWNSASGTCPRKRYY